MVGGDYGKRQALQLSFLEQSNLRLKNNVVALMYDLYDSGKSAEIYGKKQMTQ